MNRNMNELNETSFKAFREQLIKDCNDANLKKTLDSGAVVSRPALAKNKRENLSTVTPPAKRLHGNNTSNPQQNTLSTLSSDSNRRISLSPDPPVAPSTINTPAGKLYEQRKGAGQVVESYYAEGYSGFVASNKERKAPICSVNHDIFETNVQKPYRHLNTTIDDRATALDEKLEDMGSNICTRFGLGREEEEGDEDGAVAGLEAVGRPRQVQVCNVGRICNEVRDIERILQPPPDRLETHTFNRFNRHMKAR